MGGIESFIHRKTGRIWHTSETILESTGECSTVLLTHLEGGRRKCYLDRDMDTNLGGLERTPRPPQQQLGLKGLGIFCTTLTVCFP